MRNLVWFRSDLRVDDNPALNAAVRRADEGTLAVFFCCPEQWRQHDWGAPRVDFLLRSLEALSTTLQRRGIALLVETVPTFAEVPPALLAIARRFRCDQIYFNEEYEANERRRDRAARRLLAEQAIEVHSYHEQTIVPPASIRTGQGTFYTVFTPFRRAWIQTLEQNGIPTPEPLRSSSSELVCSPSAVPATLEPFERFARADLWPADEASAQQRLDDFVETRIETYDRNRDFAGEDGTSTLSPYLALGVLSIRRCLAAALAANRGRLQGGTKGIDVWMSELVWREFYRHVLVGFPRVSKNRPFKKETETIRWRHDPDSFEAWRKGKTGVPFVDAGLRQLLETGWMHNRLRMVTAMFLTKDLLIDWRLGETHFMRHLIDADLANNNGGWQWSASTGTDAAPYFRIFNPWTQGKRYDPEGAFIKRWVPELSGLPAEQLHSPQGISSAQRAELDYPEPLVDHAVARVRALEAFQQESRR